MNTAKVVTNTNLFMKITRRLSLSAAIVLFVVSRLSAAPTALAGSNAHQGANPLKPPAHGTIPVAFLMSEGAVMIDFAGPWEVFREAMVPGTQEHPFQLYTVAESTKPIHASDGMQIVPNYTLADAPAPKIVVIPAQSD